MLVKRVRFRNKLFALHYFTLPDRFDIELNILVKVPILLKTYMKEIV